MDAQVVQPRLSASVAAIEAIPIVLPVRREWLWRGLGSGVGRWVIVKVHTDEGIVGYGEATPLPDWGGDFNRYGGETQSTVVQAVTELLAPALQGSSPFDIETALLAMDERVSGHSYAKAAVEMALYDIQGKLTGQPVYQLLGGRFRQGIPIAHMIGIMGKDDALGEAAAAVGEGCRALQLKGTGELARDISVVAALREALPDEVILRLDANQGYRGYGAKATIRAMRDLRAAGVDYLEQPTEGLARMAEVREALDVPIIADESCWQPHDVVEIAEARAADAISIYVAKAGGLSRARRVAILAETYGLPCDVNGSLESAVGNAASLHLAVAMPAITLPSVIPVSAVGNCPPSTVGRYYTDDLITQSFVYKDGLLYPPDGPGLGVEVDEEKLARFSVAARD